MSKSPRYVFAVEPEDGENFWDVNKELEYLNPYAEFKKKEGKRRSGRIMHAIWLCHDPKSRAQQSGRDEDAIQNDISENFLNDKNFPWKDYKHIVKAFKEDCRTKLEKEMYYWEMELETRRVYQRNLPWDTEAETKDKLLKSQKSLYNDYIEILKEVNKERSERQSFNGTHKSLLERQ